MAIKNVAIVGASGNLGTQLTKALLNAGFSVTAISRPNSKSTFPSGVQVRRADPTSFEELKSALAGQDAVISASGTEVAVGAGQDPLIDAAVAAGVRRFIPSEFGHNGERLPEGEPLKTILGGKARTLEYLIEKAKANPKFSWTGVSNSMFFDWGLDVGVLGFKVAEKKATVFDSGDEIFSTSSLPFVSQTVAAVLKHEEETKNKIFDVVEFQTSQNQILKALEEETGAKFEVAHATTADAEKAGQEKLARGDFGAFPDFLHVWAFRDGQDHAVPDSETANKLFDLPEPSRDVRVGVQKYVRAKTAQV